MINNGTGIINIYSYSFMYQLAYNNNLDKSIIFVVIITSTYINNLV